LSRVVKGRRVHSGPQRARSPDPRRLFPCKAAISWGPFEGTIIALLDPKPAAPGLGAKAMPRCGSTCSGHGKGRQTSPSLPPKSENHGPLAVLPCKSGVSWGSGMGAMMPFMDPPVARHLSAIAVAARRDVGEGMPCGSTHRQRDARGCLRLLAGRRPSVRRRSRRHGRGSPRRAACSGFRRAR
jgi:hypothetical protein